MSKVTKLSIDLLKEMAESTPVFAPGLKNLAQMGAVHLVWDKAVPLADELNALIANMPDVRDHRGELGEVRKGRTKAAAIAERVRGLVLQTE